MRKWIAIGSALLVLAAVAGASYAQDATPEATTTPQAAAPQTPLRMGRPLLGIAVTDTTSGVTIQRVAVGSPAETAKLQVGDVILSANDTKIATVGDLQKVIAAAKAGDVIAFSVQRGGEQVSVQVTLTAQMGGCFQQAFPADPLQAAQWVLHVSLEAADGGYKVTAVDPRNPFQLAVGDVVTAVNGTAITSTDWATLFTPSTGSKAITLTVTRNGQETTLQGQFGFGRRGDGRRGGFPGDGMGPNGGMPGHQRGGQGMGQPGFPGSGQPGNPATPAPSTGSI